MGITSSNEILTQILARSQSLLDQGKPVLAVFDLDSTLFDVSPRIQTIIHAFADQPELSSEPTLREMLKAVRTQHTDWGIRTALERAGFKPLESPHALAIRDFWRAKFFSNEYLHLDRPLDGAVAFVQKLFSMGAEIAYLTGRDQIRMLPGTEKSLQQHHFPLSPPQARLAMKPMAGPDDHRFKEEWFTALPKHQYPVIWFFENEPLNINSIREVHPEIQVIFVDSTHSGKALRPTDLPTIRDFVYKAK